MMYKEKLRRKGLFSLQIRRLRIDPTTVFNSLMHCYKDRARLFSKVHSRRTRGNSQTAPREILIRYKTHTHLHSENGQTLEQVVRKDYGISVLGRYSKLYGIRS